MPRRACEGRVATSMSPLFSFSVLPVHHFEQRGKVQGYVKPMGCRGHLTGLHIERLSCRRGISDVPFRSGGSKVTFRCAPPSTRADSV